MPEYTPGKASNEIDHECQAIHCATCCPVHVAYNRGWDDGHSWADGISKMTYIKGAVSPLTIVLLITVAVLIWSMTHDSAGHDNTN